MSEKLKILVVEDEMIIAAKISLHLEQLGYEVAGTFPRGKEAIDHCHSHPPDLILMDIHLQGELDGIETAHLLRGVVNCPIIYLTANTDQATFDRAKVTGPYAFLAKPYRKQELVRTVELALLGNGTDAGDAVEEPILSDRIFVRHKQGLVKLDLRDIHFIEAQRAYCTIVVGAQTYMLSMALGRLEQQLRSADFERVHRSFLVNLRQVDEIRDNHLLVGGQSIPLGKSFRDAFLARIQLIR